MTNENKNTRDPIWIKEVIRREYPWLAERIEKIGENKQETNNG